MMNFKNEEAVSPVIGVILMVAITVILAAVIAAFVFGMAGNVGTTKNVAATATQQGSDKIVITYQGGADAPDVEWLGITAPNGTVFRTYDDGTGKLVIDDVDTTALTDEKAPAVGATMTLHYDDTDTEEWTGRDHVVVTAHFSDGADQVILDTYV
ncbi:MULTISPECIES: type IV pilin [Methanoculleus]|nr:MULTISPECIES: type IV pilin N-terminal domain-containing protein [Methanoculleus]UYU18566.1 type IV pilin N-terminal domain-containing protein [Methanoculleus submarinus]